MGTDGMASQRLGHMEDVPGTAGDDSGDGNGDGCGWKRGVFGDFLAEFWEFLAKLEVEAQRNTTALTCSSISVQQHLCMNMLSNGKPKSFIEFFNLTHSEPPEDTTKDSEAKEEKVLFIFNFHLFVSNEQWFRSMQVLSPEDLCSLSANLVEGELARRNEDFEKLSHINFIIANVFETSGHYHKAVFYLLRSLEYSKEANNSFQEAKAKFNLGKVNVKIGSCYDAITWFEEYLEFARDKEDIEALVLGSRQLLEVYDLSAKRARRKGQLQKGLELFQKSVHMAEICGDNRAKAEAKHQLGLIHQKLSESEAALQYQIEFLEFCRSEKDMVGQSKAHAAIAKIQESMGETRIAIKHLEALLEVSQHVNLETQATACCKLGLIYNQQNLYDKAHLYFKRFFKLACALKDPKLMDAARLNLGYVKNTLNMNNTVLNSTNLLNSAPLHV
ncbi:hypothetical protein L7F22_034362 [Adiantum nelumboides]|nr:hypothetical protein [Adiantum nelumboides]